MRALMVQIHRWIGLGTAAFLFIAGLTGAIIAWNHELDRSLNPHLYEAHSAGAAMDALRLAEVLEQRDPRLQVTYLPLTVEQGDSLQVWVKPRLETPGKTYELGFSQVAIDPVTGETLGARRWGELGFGREQIMPFLYRLHYSLHIPDGFGLELGMLFMGIVAIFWCLDSLVALYLSFPSRRSWRKSFAFRWRQGGYKLNFDMHRSGGVWIWLFLLILAISSISLNLNAQVMRPLVELFSPLTPSPYTSRAAIGLHEQQVPGVTRGQALELAKAEAERLGIKQPAGDIVFSPEFHLYRVGFFSAEEGWGLGHPRVFVDASSGEFIGAEIPGTGSAGDIFMQAQFPLHSGRIAGVPGRILVSLLGLCVAVLSVTGVVIWAKKRAARTRHACQSTTVGCS